MKISSRDFPTESEVDAYRIRFRTVDQHEKAYASSGLVLTPADVSQAHPILVYNHATRFSAREAPSTQRFDPEAQMLAILFASGCCIVVMPDNIGLEADAPIPQFYLNSEIQSRVTRDMLLAGRQFLKEKQIAYTNDIFISGYSQGAHNALSFQRFLQEQPLEDVRVLGSGVMSGPYALTEMTRAVLSLDQKTKIEPVFLALAILGMHEAYDDFPRFKDILLEPYASSLPAILRKGAYRDISAAFPPDVKNLFNLPTLLGVATSGEEHPFWKALALNDVDNFVPTAPVLFVHSPTDQVVPFWQAEKTFEKMKSNGAPVELFRLDKKWDDHIDAAHPAYLEVARHFQRLLPQK